jgi:glutathione S-transferase
MLKLYFSPGACALASHIALEEAGADYEGVRIDLRQGQQRTPEYLAVNPAGATPALQTDKGVITQNPAILRFVADTHPQAGLAPSGDPFEAARFDAINGWLSSSLHPALGALLFRGLEGEARESALQTALAKLDLAERHYVQGPFVFGDRFTATDGYLSVFARWARQAGILDPARFPKLNALLDAVQARPAVKRVLEKEGVPAA